MNICQLQEQQTTCWLCVHMDARSGGRSRSRVHVLCMRVTHAPLCFSRACDLPHVCMSHGRGGEHTGSSLRCVLWAGHSGSCVHACRVCGPAHVECLCEGQAHTRPAAHGCVSEQCVSERVGRSLCCVCTCSLCAGLPHWQPRRPPSLACLCRGSRRTPREGSCCRRMWPR